MPAAASPGPDPAGAAQAAGLAYVSGSAPGIRRVRRDDSSFGYVDADGREVEDQATLARIRALGIPPAYEDVWICADPRGHLQATGRDARGRKQYRYHRQWREQRDSGKFQRLRAFAEALPRLRRRVARDLALPGLPRDKVVAAVASLLDLTSARVGNAEYARTNRSYGLTTLLDHHVARASGGGVALRFRGKSGRDHALKLDDPQLCRIVRRCRQLPGPLLFQYVDEDGAAQPIDSEMVNDYLRATMGEAFTAKDFRTFTGTVRAIELLARLQPAGAKRAGAQQVNDVVREVACALGNTPAVARKSYIHPDVFVAWRRGELSRPGREPRGLAAAERIALRFLRGVPAAGADLAPLLERSRRRLRRRPAAAPRRASRRSTTRSRGAGASPPAPARSRS
jgi:DNA topoisomerase-1